MGFCKIDRDELAALMAHIANEAKIPNAVFKKARRIPSFSLVDLAPQSHLSPNFFSKLSRPPSITSRLHCMRPCSKRPGVGRMSIAGRSVIQGRRHA